MATVTVTIKLDSAGIEQFLRGPEVEADLRRRAAAIARAAGDGMHFGTVQGRKDRVSAQVWTGTVQARQAEAQDRALTRALDAGRG